MNSTTLHAGGPKDGDGTSTGNGFGWETDSLRGLALVWICGLGVAVCIYLAMLFCHWAFLHASSQNRARACVQPEHAQVIAETAARPLSNEERVALGFADLGFTTKDHRQILRGINGCVLPGELVALMGPSGAGKTTLLDVLAGRRDTSCVTGTIFVNGISRSTKKGMDFFRLRTGYMLQLANTFSTSLTVRENLAYAAALRLGTQLSVEAQLDRIELVITMLKLTKIADVVIGAVAGGGISGGQKRKVALGVEMLTMPALLLLDEPTSGLDSTSSLEVISAIRSWCDTGRSAVVTIHQPRKEVFATFNKMILLNQGRLAMHCSPTQALECVLRVAEIVSWPVGDITNPADVMLDFLSQASPPEYARHADTLGELLIHVRSKCYNMYDARLVAILEKFDTEQKSARFFIDVIARSEGREGLCGRLAHVWNVVWVMESRFLKEQTYVGLNVPSLQMIIFGAVFASLYFSSTMMISLVACVFLIATQTANIWSLPFIESAFAPSSTCYHFEVASGVYKPWERFLQLQLHFTAHTLLPCVFFTSLIYSLAFYPALSFTRLVYMLLVCLIDVQTSMAKVFVIIAMAMATKGGGDAAKLSQLITGLVEADKLFAGFYFTYAGSPAYWKFAYMSFHPFQTFPALLRIVLEGWDIPEDACDEAPSCLLSRSGDRFLRDFGYDDVDITWNAVVLISRWFLYISLACFLLERGSTTLFFFICLCLSQAFFMATVVITIDYESVATVAIGCVAWSFIVGVVLSPGLPPLWHGTVKPLFFAITSRMEPIPVLLQEGDLMLAEVPQTPRSAALDATLYAAVKSHMQEQSFDKLEVELAPHLQVSVGVMQVKDYRSQKTIKRMAQYNSTIAASLALESQLFADALDETEYVELSTEVGRRLPSRGVSRARSRKSVC